MKKLSVFQTLFYGITSAIGITFIAAYLLISNSIEENSFKQIEQSLYMQTLIYEAAIKNGDSASLHIRLPELDLLQSAGGERITLIAQNGTVLFDSQANPAKMTNHATRPEVLIAKQKGWGSSSRFSQSVQKEMIYVAKKIDLKDGNFAFVRISLPLSDQLALLKEIRLSFLQAFFIAGLIGLIIAFLFSRNFAKKVKNISLFALEIADKPESKFLFDEVMPKEFQSLLEGLNLARKRMQKLFKKVDREKQKLKKIIEYISQGLVVISKKDRIYLANDAARKIWRLEDKNKNRYTDIFDNDVLIKAIKNSQKTKKMQKVSIEKNASFYDVNIKYYPKTMDTIVIFNDITEFINLQNIKKEFVANVSHELRTPLTAIKGFLESVDHNSPLSGHHLQIIRRNTDRLIVLVDDLMSLSELENINFNLEVENFDIVILTRQILDIFSQQIKEKGLEMNLDTPDDLYITADSFRLEEVIFNLISNAIKYTEKGKISICIKKENNYVVLSVEDTGVGIPSDSLDKIFERFYVVDKSRSRASGGTGLGLSIVKHIVRLHQGEIKVKSQINMGSKFSISLPLATKI